MSAKNKPNELYLTRVYDAPIETVWKSWTDIEQVSKWWGPRGFSITTHSKDLRPGGHWAYTMHGPDGVDYPNKTIYYEVEECARLVYDHGGNDDQPPLFRVQVVFSKAHDMTKMDLTMSFSTTEKANEAKAFIKQAGGNATWDRLAEHLAKETKGIEAFFINESFDVPQATLFEVWTDPKHISKWLPPTGFNMEYLRADIKPGGEAFYVMSNESGLKMYGKAHYIEITKPNRIVYTQEFCDENEKPARHPMAPTWPASMLTQIILTEEGLNQTRVRVEWQVHGEATKEEMDTFIQGRPGMTMGWTGSFDKLAAYLDSIAKS